jgi:hypothetical protein
LPVRSEVRLPIRESDQPEVLPAAWTIRLADPSEARPRPEVTVAAASPTEDSALEAGAGGSVPGDYDFGDYFVVARQDDGTWWWWEGQATIHIRSDARMVTVFPQPELDMHTLSIVLMGPVAAFVLCQLGYPTLHASAVVTTHGAVAFLGPRGRGKSTMAAAFLRRGAALLTDDILALRAGPDGVCGMPGPPLMKMWQPTVQHTLGLLADGLPNVVPDLDKKLLVMNGQYPLARAATPLRALYLLDRRAPCPAGIDAVVSRVVSKREGLTLLLGQVYGALFLNRAETSSFLPLFARLTTQATIRVLTYPSLFDWQDTVVAQIERDLRAS